MPSHDVSDPFDLQRFVRAQAETFDQAREEVAAGRKRSHWMWFVFPQLAGLGHSPTARAYAIASLDEARAYLAHPLLGARLLDITALATATAPERSAHDIFGSPDDLKLRSCLTLFGRAAPDEPAFRDALGRFFGASPDPATVSILESNGTRG